MSGITDQDDRAPAGHTGDAAAGTAAAYNELGLQVNAENVLSIYAAFAEEVARLRLVLRNFQRNYGDGMPLLGRGHPVSPHFARSFNESTAHLVSLCKSDIDDLDQVAQGLRVAAMAYGKSDRQIADAFDPAPPVDPSTLAAPQSDRNGSAIPPIDHSLDTLFRGGIR